MQTFAYFQGYSPNSAYVRKCKNCA